MERNRVWVGEVRDFAAGLEPQSVQCMVTSPPYFGLRDYGIPPTDWPAMEYAPLVGLPPIAVPAMTACLGLEPTPDAFIGHIVAVFRALLPALKEDAVCWINFGDSYASSPPGNVRGVSERSGLNGANSEKYRATLMAGHGTKRDTSKLGLPPKSLLMIPHRVALALQAEGWVIRQDCVWCLSGGTRVYARTQKGEMPTTIKDLVRLDPATVQLWNGQKWTQVLGWSQSETRDGALELELRSGERIGCTPNHVWPTQRGNVRTDELRIGDVIQTCQLPGPSPVRVPSLLSHEAIGWFVGMYIAEGSQSDGTIQIACHADDTSRFARLRTLAGAFDGSAAFHVTSAHGATININSPVLRGVIDAYVSGRTAKDKHLHVRCWKRGDTFLKEVLTGYLEGDGHYDGYNERWRLGFTENDSLAADLRTLCARLGYGLRLRRTFHKMFDQRFPGYRGEIRTERSTHHNAKQDGEIVAIGMSRARQFWDIGVEDEPHLFALASGVLTHNSKPNPMPESVRDRPTRAHEYVFLIAKGPRYYYDQEAIREPHGDEARRAVERGWRRPGKTAPANNPQLPAGQVQQFKQAHSNYFDQDGNLLINPAGRNKRSVWTVPPAQFPDAHFATFAPDLIRPCILAGTSERGECAACGKAWVRVVEREPAEHGSPVWRARNRRGTGRTARGLWQATAAGRSARHSTSGQPAGGPSAPATRPRARRWSATRSSARGPWRRWRRRRGATGSAATWTRAAWAGRPGGWRVCSGGSTSRRTEVGHEGSVPGVRARRGRTPADGLLGTLPAPSRATPLGAAAARPLALAERRGDPRGRAGRGRGGGPAGAAHRDRGRAAVRAKAGAGRGAEAPAGGSGAMTTKLIAVCCERCGKVVRPEAATLALGRRTAQQAGE
jgi:hypothetical protein